MQIYEIQQINLDTSEGVVHFNLYASLKEALKALRKEAEAYEVEVTEDFNGMLEEYSGIPLKGKSCYKTTAIYYKNSHQRYALYIKKRVVLE